MRPALVFVALVLVALAAPEARAQAIGVPDLTLERRMALYERARIEPAGALWRSVIAPGWGNIYANHIFKGVAFGAGFAMSAFVGLVGLSRDDPGFTYSGLGAASVLYVASLTTGYLDALQYNENLRKRYKIDEPAPAVAWGWTY